MARVSVPQAEAGIYVLANDRVLEWTIALLESLRIQHPSTPLWMIPYDHQVSGLLAIRSAFDFEMLDADMSSFDRVARTLGVPERSHGTFRKLACFVGPLQRFAYLDADHVVTSSLDSVLNGVGTSEIAFALESARGHVFRSGDLADSTCPVFNTGAFGSSRDVVTLAAVEDVAAEAASLRDSFADTYEQPFINFLISRLQIGTSRFTDYAPDHRFMWAGDQANLTRSPDGWHDEHARQIGSIHWAGFGLGPGMPQRSMWMRYRHRSSPTATRVAVVATDPVVRASAALIVRGRRLLGRRHSRDTSG